jgi:MFS family permease
VAPLTGRFVGNHGTRLPLLGGSLALMASGIILAQLTRITPFAELVVAYVLVGLGSGLINPPITNTAVSGMPPSQAGVAAAVASTGRQVGQTLGVAVLGALAAGGALGSIGPTFAVDTHVSWWIVVALGGLIFVLGAITTTPWADGTARRTAERFREDGPTAAPRPATPVAEPTPVG